MLTVPRPAPYTIESVSKVKQLAKARGMWAALDKNRDNIWQYDELPHPDWRGTNGGGADGLHWKEELADQILRKLSHNCPKKHGSGSQKEWPTQQAWNKDRADFKLLFAFIDWDQDGVITAAE